MSRPLQAGLFVGYQLTLQGVKEKKIMQSVDIPRP